MARKAMTRSRPMSLEALRTPLRRKASTSGRRQHGALAYVVPALYFLVLLGLSMSLSPEKVAHFLRDDSFFYVKTAVNFNHGNGFSFDGFNHTNGFQYLYMLILVGLDRVISLETLGGLRALLALHGLLVLGAAVVANQVLKPYFGLGLRAAALSMIVAASVFVDIGTEAPLLLLAAWVYVFALLRQLTYRGSGSHGAFVAVATVIVCLARTDAMLLPLVCGAVAGLAVTRGEGWRQGVLVAATSIVPVLLVIAVTSALNLALTGHATAISAYLKTDFPDFRHNAWFWQSGLSLKLRGRLLLPVLIALPTLLLLVPAWLHSRGLRLAFPALLTGLNLYVLAYAASIYLFAASGMGTLRLGTVQNHYFTIMLTVAALDVVFLTLRTSTFLREAGDRFERPLLGRLAALSSMALLVGVIGLSSLHVYTERVTPGKVDVWIEAAAWVRGHTPADARIFMIDGSGQMGYWSQRSLINGDGLINSWDYYDAVNSGTVAAWLTKNHVGYFVTDRPQVTVTDGVVSENIQMRNSPTTRVTASIKDATVSLNDTVWVFPLTAVQFTTLP